MKNKQTGGALMISMVLIFMMSIMGISAMRSATLEKRMATNSIHKSTTLQAAESSTEMALGNSQNLSSAWAQNGKQVHPSITLNGNSALVTSASVRYTGEGPPIGSSMGVGSGFSALRFETVGDASIDTVQARSRIVQGAYVVAPSP